MSTHTEHYHFLDLVRAIGILQVVLFHVVFGVFSYGGSDAAHGPCQNQQIRYSPPGGC